MDMTEYVCSVVEFQHVVSFDNSNWVLKHQDDNTALCWDDGQLKKLFDSILNHNPNIPAGKKWNVNYQLHQWSHQEIMSHIQLLLVLGNIPCFVKNPVLMIVSVVGKCFTPIKILMKISIIFYLSHGQWYKSNSAQIFVHSTITVRQIKLFISKYQKDINNWIRNDRSAKNVQIKWK